MQAVHQHEQHENLPYTPDGCDLIVSIAALPDSKSSNYICATNRTLHSLELCMLHVAAAFSWLMWTLQKL